MRLPNGESAIVPIEKLKDYCLDPGHLTGRNKARVFQSALGLTKENAELLRAALVTAARNDDALATDADEYGERYVLDFWMSVHGRAAIVRSSWIVRSGETTPRLTSCYVKVARRR
jgi:hypothetical protein